MGRMSTRIGWISSRTMVGALVLVSLVACGGATAEAPPPSEDLLEMEFWQSVKDSGDADQLLAYIKRYPEGPFVELAETRLKGLNEGEARAPSADAAKASPTPPSTPPAAASAPPAASTPVGNDEPAPSAQASSSRAPSARASSLSRRSSSSRGARSRARKATILDVVDDSLDGYYDARLHVHPQIPTRKAYNAASVHGIDPQSILVLYDDGLMGGGKTGFVVTDERVHWRFVSGADPYSVSFDDIRSARPRQNKFILNGAEIGTTMSSSPSHAAQVYADLMLDLRDAMR